MRTCKYCKQQKPKQKELWATRWCCRECAIRSKEAVTKGFKEGGLKGMIDSFLTSYSGTNIKGSVDKTKNEVKGWSKKKRKRLVKKLKKTGVSEEDIRKGWIQMGIIKEGDDLY